MSQHLYLGVALLTFIITGIAIPEVFKLQHPICVGDIVIYGALAVMFAMLWPVAFGFAAFGAVMYGLMRFGIWLRDSRG